MRGCRQPRRTAPGHAHVLLARALITARNHPDRAMTAHRSGAEARGEDPPGRRDWRIPALQARASGGDTVLTGPLCDRAALHGVLAEIEALGLELLEVRRLPPA
jgi:hypothetical protein